MQSFDVKTRRKILTTAHVGYRLVRSLPNMSDMLNASSALVRRHARVRDSATSAHGRHHVGGGQCRDIHVESRMTAELQGSL